MTLQTLAYKIHYGQCILKPEGISFARWSGMCKAAQLYCQQHQIDPVKNCTPQDL